MSHRISKLWPHVTAGLLAAVYGVVMMGAAFASRAYIGGRGYTYHEPLLAEPRVQVALLLTTVAVYAAVYGAIIGLARAARWQHSLVTPA